MGSFSWRLRLPSFLCPCYLLRSTTRVTRGNRATLTSSQKDQPKQLTRKNEGKRDQIQNIKPKWINETMILPQLFAILACAVVIGTSITHFPPMVAHIRASQSAITSGVSSAYGDPSGAAWGEVGGGGGGGTSATAELLEGGVGLTASHVEVGDVVSLTAGGRMDFGSHTGLMRYPSDTYLTAMAPLASSPTALPEVYTAAVVSIREALVQSSSTVRLSSAASSFSLSGLFSVQAADASDREETALFDSLFPSPPTSRSVRHAGRSSNIPHNRAVMSAQAVSSEATNGVVLSPIIRVNSSRGVVGIDQCTVLIPATASGSASGASYAAADDDDARDAATFPLPLSAGLQFHAAGIDDATEPVPPTAAPTSGDFSVVSRAIPIGSSLAAPRTNAAIVLFREETVPVRPENENPHFSSEAAVDTYAPLLPYADADRKGYNRGQRGFPLVSDAFFLLQYLHTQKQLSTERMPLPLVVDEDPTDSVSLFPFGLRGARQMGRATSASHLQQSSSSDGRSAVFLVPIPRKYRQANFPASDTECVRLGVNRSTHVTNIGLVPSPIGGSVPILYHRGCFMAVVSALSSVHATSDSVSSAMSTAVSQWLSINDKGATDGVYRDSVMAVRRASSGAQAGEEGGFTGKDGSRWVFAPTRLGPAATSAVYRDTVQPMRDSYAQYFPPMFITWIGGVHRLGVCTSPQFVNERGARRILFTVDV